jgi:hypothetical protein
MFARPARISVFGAPWARATPAAVRIAPDTILAFFSAHPRACAAGFDFHLTGAYELTRGDETRMELGDACEVKRQLPMKVCRFGEIVANQSGRA